MDTVISKHTGLQDFDIKPYSPGSHPATDTPPIFRRIKFARPNLR